MFVPRLNEKVFAGKTTEDLLATLESHEDELKVHKLKPYIHADLHVDILPDNRTKSQEC